MTRRLYLDAPGESAFSACVVERRNHEGGQLLHLDQTLFYVEGGGQPADRGTIDGVQVVRVYEEEGVVWHQLSGVTAGEVVSGLVDMAARLDFSTQHTGQHILSQAFWRLFGAATSSFHLTEASVSIDISRTDLSGVEISAGEDLANDIVRRALPVGEQLFSKREDLPEEVRKNPQIDGDVRLITVGDFDMCPCAGTHVQNTAQVQLIKILHTEQTRGRLRVYFVCGERALSDYRARLESDKEVSVLLSSPYKEHAAATKRLMEAEELLRRDNSQLHKALLSHRARQTQASAVCAWGEIHLFPEWEGGQEEARLFLTLLCQERQALAVLTMATDPARIMVQSSTIHNAGDILKKLVSLCGGRGGGNGYSAQGSVPASCLDSTWQGALSLISSLAADETI